MSKFHNQAKKLTLEQARELNPQYNHLPPVYFEYVYLAFKGENRSPEEEARIIELTKNDLPEVK